MHRWSVWWEPCGVLTLRPRSPSWPWPTERAWCRRLTAGRPAALRMPSCLKHDVWPTPGVPGVYRRPRNAVCYQCSVAVPESRLLPLLTTTQRRQHLTAFCLLFYEKVKKSKVDNFYSGSKRSRSLLNRFYNTPLVHWTHAVGCHILYDGTAR